MAVPTNKPSIILPLNIGIIADPSSLILSYTHEANGTTKYRRRKIPLRDFSEKSDVVKVAFAIKQRHSEHLRDVHLVSIEKLLRIIQEILKGLDRSAAVIKVNAEFNIDPEEDLNKLSIKDLIRKKELMEEIYNKSVVRPNDPNFIYDKEVDFDHIESASQKSQNYTDWDDDEGSETKHSDESCIKMKNMENIDSLKQSEVTSGPTSDRSRLYEVEDNVDIQGAEDRVNLHGVENTSNLHGIEDEDTADLQDEDLQGVEVEGVVDLHKDEDTNNSHQTEDIEDLQEVSPGNSYQFIPLVISSKIEGRNKSLFEKPSPITLDELDDNGLEDIEIEPLDPIELDDDDFW